VSQEVSPLTSGRLSHSSEPLNGGGSLTGTDSPPISPSDEFDDVVKVLSRSTLFPFSLVFKWGEWTRRSELLQLSQGAFV